MKEAVTVRHEEVQTTSDFDRLMAMPRRAEQKAEAHGTVLVPRRYYRDQWRMNESEPFRPNFQTERRCRCGAPCSECPFCRDGREND